MTDDTLTPPYGSKGALLISDINQQIADGTWVPGTQIPSTASLAAHYGIAMGTVRNGIQRLITRGVLRGHQGIGVFVTERPTSE